MLKDLGNFLVGFIVDNSSVGLLLVLLHFFFGTDDVIFLDIDVVSLVVEEVDQDGADTSSGRDTSVHPSKLGVFGDRDKCETKDGCKAVGKQEQGHDNGLHGLRSLLVSVLETGDRGKDFRQGDEEV